MIDMQPAVLVAGNLPSVLRRALTDRVYETVRHPVLPGPESFHPDMQLFSAGDGRMVCCPELYAHYRGLLPARVLLCGRTPLRADYPHNIAYNALRVGSRLFCLRAHTDPVILRMAEESGWTVVDVKQGYANCSAVAAGENALVTADPSIADAALRQGMDVLRISSGHIRLAGYPFGFIGGCCGRISDGRLYILGSLDSHPDAARIAVFFQAHGVTAVCVPKQPLSDYGALLRVI